MLSSLLLDFQFTQLLNPQFYIENGGLWLLLLVVFAETGLFVGFFLPGDSLLFIAGIYSSELIEAYIPTGNEYLDLLLLMILITAAGILGNWVGYTFGRKIGPTMFGWNDSFLFKKKYLIQAQEFYEKHGAGAIVIARFLPIIRTFAPIIAGIVQMNRSRFAVYNVIGCIAWVGSMLVGGHFLQKIILAQFGFDLKSHLEIIVLGIVLVTTTPVVLQIIKGNRKHKNAHTNNPTQP